MNKPYLTKEEQFKDILNNEEIQRIEDVDLREIRQRYWNLAHKAFLDEAGIPDWELNKVVQNIHVQEQKEIAKYRQKKGV